MAPGLIPAALDSEEPPAYVGGFFTPTGAPQALSDGRYVETTGYHRDGSRGRQRKPQRR